MDRRFNIIFASLLQLFAQIVVANTGITIWAVPMQPNWPVTMAAIIPPNLSLSNRTIYSWTFPTSRNPSCTVDGRQNVTPCRGKVLDHHFPEGTHLIQLRVEDPTLPSAVEVSVQIEIKPISAFPVAIRPEIRQISEDTWRDKYLKAIYMLKAIGVYDHLSKIHRSTFTVGSVAGSGTQRSSAHSSPSFLPWHRVSMRVLERCIQVAADDDEIGLPYWDWMKGSDGIDRYMGGTGDASKNYVVQSGPFSQANWVLPADFPDPIKALKRNFSADASYRFQTQEEFDKLMSIPVYDLPPFNERPTPGSFRNALEGWITASGDTSYGFNHNGIHRWVGGTMGEVTVSFHDPLFHIHHSQVDRMFTLWQKLQKCDDGHGSAECYRPGETDPDVNAGLAGAVQDKTPGGRNRYALQGAMFTDPMFPWAIRPVDTLRVEQGYRFLNPDEKQPASSGRKGPRVLRGGAAPPAKSGADRVNAFFGVGSILLLSYIFI